MFKKPKITNNILILGDEGIGKRSFVLFFKEQTIASGVALPEMKEIALKKKIAKGGLAIPLNFTLDRSSDALIPSAFPKATKIDLILIATDLSSPDALDRLTHYTKLAQMNYPNIPTLNLGTKSDKKHPGLELDQKLIPTSAKTGEGFDIFTEQLEPFFNLSDRDERCVLS